MQTGKNEKKRWIKIKIKTSNKQTEYTIRKRRNTIKQTFGKKENKKTFGKG